MANVTDRDSPGSSDERSGERGVDRFAGLAGGFDPAALSWIGIHERGQFLGGGPAGQGDGVGVEGGEAMVPQP